MDSMEISTPKAREIVPTRNLVRSELFPEVLRFRFEGVCDDPIFGSAKDLEGEIPLLNPSIVMRNQHAELVANPGILERHARDVVVKYRELWPDQDDEEILSNVKSLVLVHLLLVGPNPAMDPDLLDKFVQWYVVMVTFDDLFDKNLSDTFPDPNTYDYGEVMATLRSQDCFQPQHFPSGLAGWKSFSKIMETFQYDFTQSVPDGARHLAFLRDSFYSGLCAVIALSHLDRQEPGAPRYSEESMFELRRIISGGQAAYEFNAMAKGLHLSPVVRADQVFRIAVNRAADILSMHNAILGLRRDVRLGQTDSVITSLVVDGGKKLQDAFDVSMRRLHDLYNDYMVAKRQLLQFFKTEANLPAYLECIDAAIDGTLYVHTIMERYGIQGNCVIVPNPLLKQ